MKIKKSFQYSLCQAKRFQNMLPNHFDPCLQPVNLQLKQDRLAYGELIILLSKYQQKTFSSLLKEETCSLNRAKQHLLYKILRDFNTMQHLRSLGLNGWGEIPMSPCL
ncbi:hypothetical protein CpB0624 [Chlamydia pneumoniae TW-183]|uniref:Uncharacterized protein n=3 Tax=Chlamydia pneumoniae TaxID=83558 RepID=Q9Z7V4_CHLPN|nr:hypothetical protein CPn_0600 [Chlamydia pneumoniae CWL029]AAF38030.1 hypothetical protein CP_0148 [Chlamydia pneumoniae AR39]AAP98553.1 hypothetical protein CpB0624 [Chlamydia pneumoniae TW-183]BAA98807.1 hypothetical protein [Chlamydia pneumoniae J138]